MVAGVGKIGILLALPREKTDGGGRKREKREEALGSGKYERPTLRAKKREQSEHVGLSATLQNWGIVEVLETSISGISVGQGSDTGVYLRMSGFVPFEVLTGKKRTM